MPNASDVRVFNDHNAVSASAALKNRYLLLANRHPSPGPVHGEDVFPKGDRVCRRNREVAYATTARARPTGVGGVRESVGIALWMLIVSVRRSPHERHYPMSQPVLVYNANPETWVEDDRRASPSGRLPQADRPAITQVRASQVHNRVIRPASQAILTGKPRDPQRG